MTNYEKIKNLSSKMMASLLLYFNGMEITELPFCHDRELGAGCHVNNCIACLMSWLAKEADENV